VLPQFDFDTFDSHKYCNFYLFCRVSCEAIPEEISGLGTMPPAGDSEGDASSHPQLLSCHSYPGTGLTQSLTLPSAASRTVPQSPTSTVSNGICVI
jgi:hypothetical protein